MKTIEVDDELYAYIAGQTESIGESASEILRRLLLGKETNETETVQVAQNTETKDVFELLDKETLKDMPKKVDQFLTILSALYQSNSASFVKVEEIKGKGRLYFAQSEHVLKSSGKSINAKLIPGSPYWVVTNNNSAKKVSILKQVMTALGYQNDTIEKVVDLFVQ